MARLDRFIKQLIDNGGDAILIEGGKNVFLMNGQQLDPLLDAAKGAALQTEHVQMLVREVAPHDQQRAIENNSPVSFVYDSGFGPMQIKTAMRDGRLMARVKPSMSGAVSSEGPPARGGQFQVLPSMEGAPVVEDPVPTRPDGPAPAFSSPLGGGPMMNVPDASADGPPLRAELAPVGAGDKPRAEAWFTVFLKSRASDLHLTSGRPATMRIDGDIKPEPMIPMLSGDKLEEHLLEIMPARNRKEYEETSDTDFAYEMPDARLRCNVFRDIRGPAAVFRRIPNKILSAKDLNLPPAVLDLCTLKKGLVLVTGPTGSGKSTTLAAMVDWINANREEHIITVEDPIEFVHEPKKCLIHQRQVGEHTKSFSRALRAALREDPDIVLVGEMRDLETVAIAIETAETGHLVFGTLHTTTASSTVDRIIDQFPADRQDQIRTMLAESLKGVVSQTLCKKRGSGRVAALEILLSTTAVANAIREGKTHQIPSTMQTSRGLGMRTLNDALLDLAKSQTITPEEAVNRSLERNHMIKELRAIGMNVPD